MYRLQGLIGVLLVMVLAAGAVYLWQRDGDDGGTIAITPSATPTPTAEPGPTATPEPTSTPVPLPTPDLVLAADFAFDQTDRLTTSGIGLIFFGDPVEEAGEKQGTEWDGLPTGAKPTCYEVTPKGGPPGMTFTVVNGRIERVDVTTEIITTPSGAGVSMSEADLLGLFDGSLDIAADGDGNRIEFIANDEADQEFRIVWQTDGSTVTSMRAGRIPHITPTAPC